MTKYNLTLTAAEIFILKKSITTYQLEIIKQLKIEDSDKGFKALQKEQNFANEIYNSITYQLSDQQNLPAPLSQREYPQ